MGARVCEREGGGCGFRLGLRAQGGTYIGAAEGPGHAGPGGFGRRARHDRTRPLPRVPVGHEVVDSPNMRVPPGSGRKRGERHGTGWTGREGKTGRFGLVLGPRKQERKSGLAAEGKRKKKRVGPAGLKRRKGEEKVFHFLN